MFYNSSICEVALTLACLWLTTQAITHSQHLPPGPETPWPLRSRCLPLHSRSQRLPSLKSLFNMSSNRPECSSFSLKFSHLRKTVNTSTAKSPHCLTCLARSLPGLVPFCSCHEMISSSAIKYFLVIVIV